MSNHSIHNNPISHQEVSLTQLGLISTARDNIIHPSIRKNGLMDRSDIELLNEYVHNVDNTFDNLDVPLNRQSFIGQKIGSSLKLSRASNYTWDPDVYQNLKQLCLKYKLESLGEANENDKLSNEIIKIHPHVGDPFDVKKLTASMDQLISLTKPAFSESPTDFPILKGVPTRENVPTTKQKRHSKMTEISASPSNVEQHDFEMQPKSSNSRFLMRTIDRQEDQQDQEISQQMQQLEIGPTQRVIQLIQQPTQQEIQLTQQPTQRVIQRPIEQVIQQDTQQPTQQSIQQVIQAIQQSIQQQPIQQSIQRQPIQQSIQRQPIQQSIQRQPIQQSIQRQPIQQSIQRQPIQQSIQRQPIQQHIQQSIQTQPQIHLGISDDNLLRMIAAYDRVFVLPPILEENQCHIEMVQNTQITRENQLTFLPRIVPNSQHSSIIPGLYNMIRENYLDDFIQIIHPEAGLIYCRVKVYTERPRNPNIIFGFIPHLLLSNQYNTDMIPVYHSTAGRVFIQVMKLNNNRPSQYLLNQTGLVVGYHHDFIPTYDDVTNLVVYIPVMVLNNNIDNEPQITIGSRHPKPATAIHEIIPIFNPQTQVVIYVHAMITPHKGHISYFLPGYRPELIPNYVCIQLNVFNGERSTFPSQENVMKLI